MSKPRRNSLLGRCNQCNSAVGPNFLYLFLFDWLCYSCFSQRAATDVNP